MNKKYIALALLCYGCNSQAISNNTILAALAGCSGISLLTNICQAFKYKNIKNKKLELEKQLSEEFKYQSIIEWYNHGVFHIKKIENDIDHINIHDLLSIEDLDSIKDNINNEYKYIYQFLGELDAKVIASKNINMSNKIINDILDIRKPSLNLINRIENVRSSLLRNWDLLKLNEKVVRLEGIYFKELQIYNDLYKSPDMLLDNIKNIAKSTYAGKSFMYVEYANALSNAILEIKTALSKVINYDENLSHCIDRANLLQDKLSIMINLLIENDTYKRDSKAYNDHQIILQKLKHEADIRHAELSILNKEAEEKRLTAEAAAVKSLNDQQALANEKERMALEKKQLAREKQRMLLEAAKIAEGLGIKEVKDKCAAEWTAKYNNMVLSYNAAKQEVDGLKSKLNAAIYNRDKEWEPKYNQLARQYEDLKKQYDYLVNTTIHNLIGGLIATREELNRISASVNNDLDYNKIINCANYLSDLISKLKQY